METTRVSSTAFDGTTHAPAAARRFVRQVLGEWRLNHLAEDAVLLTSELVTNAVVHAGTGIELTCRLDAEAVPPKLEIEVDDQQPDRVILDGPAPAGPLATSGRGLALAGMLADAWGVTYTRTTKRVWVRMEFADAQEPPCPPVPAPREPVDALRVAVLVADAGGRVISWNADAESLLGWTARQVAGRPLEELVDWHGHGGDTLALSDTLGLGRWRGESRMRHRDGRLVPVYVSHLRTGGPPEHRRAIWMVVGGAHGFVLASPPSPARREAGRRIKDLLDRDRPFAELLDTIARIAQHSSAGDAAYVLLRADSGHRFGVAAGAGATAGLVGVVAAGAFAPDPGTPPVVEDLLAADVELAQQLRARSLACAPLVAAGEVVGYLAVTAADPGRFDQDLPASLRHIADQVAGTVQRERLAEQERAHRGRLSFLAEAGELLAGVHEEEMIAVLAAQLVVPKLATWAAIYLTDLAGMTRLAHVWHREERHNPGLRESLPAIPHSPLSEVTWPIGRENVLSFPLLTHGRSYGALVIGRAEPTLPLELADLLADLCRLIALNLHTAMLYARQATTSKVLQRSLLPVRMAPMPGLESAVVYQPAGEGADVGGDFYDLFTVADHWCFALGDVCGSGPEAAAVTGLARHAVRLLAKENYTVADILHRLNRTLLEEADDEDGRFLSLLCGELTPLPQGGALCTIASAGHVPPLLLRACGKVEQVASPQLLLGVEADARFSVETFELAPEEVLLCVTDGVTERRDGDRLLDDDDGLARILSECAGLSAHAVAERVRQAVDSFADAPSRDDVALLVLRATPSLL